MLVVMYNIRHNAKTTNSGRLTKDIGKAEAATVYVHFVGLAIPNIMALMITASVPHSWLRPWLSTA